MWTSLGVNMSSDTNTNVGVLLGHRCGLLGENDCVREAVENPYLIEIFSHNRALNATSMC